MTTPSRLDLRGRSVPHTEQPCPAVFPGEPHTTCEGREGHVGPHVARVTVTWEDDDAAS